MNAVVAIRGLGKAALLIDNAQTRVMSANVISNVLGVFPNLSIARATSSPLPPPLRMKTSAGKLILNRTFHH